jgi:hypothetical protein
MVKTTLHEALESSFIQETSKAVCELTSSSIYPVYNEILSQATEEQIEKSGQDLSDLIDHAKINSKTFIRQAVGLILLSQGEPIEQAYSNIDSDLPKSWKPKKSLGLSKDFIIPHMIIFWFLEKSPGKLEEYLKATKNPQAKQLAKRYIEGFKYINNNLI